MEKHRIGPDGRLVDDISSHPLSNADRASYDIAAMALSKLKPPVLLHRDSPHERLFIANFDGTGNDVDADAEHSTNVGKFHRQIRKQVKDGRVSSKYVEGPGTQTNGIVRLADGVRGFTYEERLERMYKHLVEDVRRWKRDDPYAQVSIIVTGFSRGAEQAAGFSRLVDERGIRSGKQKADGSHQLIPPGQIPQAVALFDPVGTGHPYKHDRRLPPSVVSGLQIYARDEKRNAFPSSQIIPWGFSPDGRFLGITVAGAHSDIGGSYHADGLAVLNGNLMTDFINAHSEVELLQRRLEPEDPAQYVVNHSQDHLWIYGTSRYDENGQRDMRGAQVSAPNCRPVVYCDPPEPLDPGLLERISDRRPVQVHMPRIPVLLDDISLGRPVPTQAMARDVPSMAQTFPVKDEQTWNRDASPVLPDRLPASSHPVTPSSAGQRVDVPVSETPAWRQAPSVPSVSPASSVMSFPRNDPRNERHPDHRMYQSIYLQMGELHVRNRIDASQRDLERISAVALVEAKRAHMKSVTDIEFGKDERGGFVPTLHVMEAFRGDLDDPRARWASFEAFKAIEQPVEQAIQQLDATNDHLEHRRMAREHELAQQQGRGMSMGF